MAYIYFLVYSDGAIKIGCTKKLKKRITELMVDCGVVEASPVRMLGYFRVRDETMLNRETNVHSKFLEYRFQGNDYFRCSDELVEFIRENCHTKCREMNEYIKFRWGRCRRAKRLLALEKNNVT